MKSLILVVFLFLGLSSFASTNLVRQSSWYGEELRGRPMANTKPFNPDALTCASWDFPLGTKLEVSHANKKVIVTVTDRGPNKRFRKDPDPKKWRGIDLTKAAFTELADPKVGLITVEIRQVAK